MSLCEIIIAEYPELKIDDFHPKYGVISLRNDADEFGDYIAKWKYSKPIPDGLKLGKQNNI